MATNPKIQEVNLENNTEEIRTMSSEENKIYSDILAETDGILTAAKNKIRQKEEVVAKLALLGLTEEDIRIVMS